MPDHPPADADERGRLRDVVGDWLAGSRVGRAWGRLSARLATAADASVVGRLADTAGRWTRGSFCYRWLTAEPEPDVIVIDLRETYTVGPMIRLLERVTEPLATAWDRSSTEATGRAIGDAPVRALGIVVGVAVLVEVALSLALGGISQAGVGWRLILLGLAALAVQIPLSASELAATRGGRLLWAVLEPPEPSEQRDSQEETAIDKSATEDGD
ncbi:hypothetical protein [Halorientalis halophila]|uniref:hypothetical protein n=1 Tax=Halorientalis halophila TaxID=3108499 RepID=UPI003008FC84